MTNGISAVYDLWRCYSELVLPIDAVSQFIDPEVLVKPLQRIKRERWVDMNDLQREATDAFFAAWSASPMQSLNP